MQTGLFDKKQDTARALLVDLASSADCKLSLPHLLLVFAHPDDEVLAVGGRLERMAASRLLTLTDGAPTDARDAWDHGFQSLEAYRAARRRELEAALAHAGLSEEFVVPFTQQIPDQTASFHLATLTRAVAEQMAALRPEAVLTHPYEGGHPDHDACAFAVHYGARLLAEAEGGCAPLILEAPSYHAGENGAMRTGAFLPGSEEELSEEVQLTEAEAKQKRERLACFASQTETLAQFSSTLESFRVAPCYDFMKPPHAGQLMYEHYGWGMTGKRFCELAGAALAHLFPTAMNSLGKHASWETECAS